VTPVFVTRLSRAEIISTLPDQFSGVTVQRIAPWCMSAMLTKRRVSIVVSRPARSRMRWERTTVALRTSYS
jgi:hypothetical protein